MKQHLRAAILSKFRANIHVVDTATSSGDEDAEMRGLHVERGNDTDVAIIAFGGLKHGLGMPPFEFFGQLHSVPVHRIFVRDHHQCWYHRGVRETSHDLTSTTLALQDVLASLKPKRVVCVGTSAGGYAAMLFGHSLGVDEVLAFGPQVSISDQFRAEIGDNRWLRAMANLPDRPESHESRDLARVLSQPSKTIHRVFIGRADALDVAHGQHIAHIPGVIVREIASRHNTAGRLRRTGALPILLRDAVAGQLEVPPSHA